MDARSLASTLASADEGEIGRIVADWLDRATRADELDLAPEPPLSGRRHLDALVAAATAEVARKLGRPTPPRAIGEQRTAEVNWYPGPPSLFPNALVHALGKFAVRGVLIEADSLAGV